MKTMKTMKTIFMLLFVATLCFTACSDDDNDNGSTKMPNNPAGDIEGTYFGTWTRTYQESSKEAESTVTLTATDSFHATLDVAACSTLSVSAMSSPCNVTWNSNNDYIFNFNILTSTNDLGTAFAGKVFDGETIQFSFTKKTGRPAKEYTFTFVGTRK